MPFPSDPTSSDGVLADAAARTLGLALDAARGGDGRVSGASRLPGWSRGHVLAHLADNADALTAALRRATTTDDAGLMYPSREVRDRSIDSGATRSASEHTERLLESAHDLALAWRAFPADRLHATLSGTAGWTRPVADIPWMRWRELALHGVDLGLPAEFAPGDPLVARLLDETAVGFVARPDVPGCEVIDTERGRTWRFGGGGPAIEGSTSELALWLTGRGDGSALAASGPLPALPPWL